MFAIRITHGLPAPALEPGGKRYQPTAPGQQSEQGVIDAIDQAADAGKVSAHSGPAARVLELHPELAGVARVAVAAVIGEL